MPQRTVVYEGGSADKMFVLGLTKHVHGYVMPPANPPVTESPWAAEYAKVKLLSDDLLNRELVVDAQADLVVAGWNSGFSDKRGITPEILDGLGIHSFVHTTRNLPAVVNNRFFVLDYNEGISGPRSVDDLEKFAEYLRGIQS